MIRIKLNWERNAVKLAARLMEKLAAKAVVTAIKRSEVILDDSFAAGKLQLRDLHRILAESLREAGISYESVLIAGRDEIRVSDLKPNEDEEMKPKIFICPHCGFVTPYEEEYWNHVKIHYVGF